MSATSGAVRRFYDLPGGIQAYKFEHEKWYRERALETRAGTVGLKIPRLRTGSYFPGKVHFLRNALVYANKGRRQGVLAVINIIFEQDSPEAASAQWRLVTDQLHEKFLNRQR